MSKFHHYQTLIEWTGNTGMGTRGYLAYQRNFDVTTEGKAQIAGSADPHFRGDKSRHNPEELFLASIASCHMLWYLHLCAEAGVSVVNYEDHAEGIMQENKNGSGQFNEVVLYPVVTVENEDMKTKAMLLHEEAQKHCFIANSCNFNIRHKPVVRIASKKQSYS
ncbi:OsmC family peroxiredoxin [Echinicola strongylocentroti]|uniref:OsmC family peroxiredoxin n=1 Tax=Echinicola strongylocentroti TaxID=1795355 RepID=A0A2Z4IHQ8_9BACT|nr:OsmC family protein [Echinicola strongylocentroti]AWW29953.1 OsmC family peroxiredoxin [Echinicola strongylocentroti]